MLRAAGALKGSNQESMRQFNERVVLEAIRRQGPLTKAELARQTGLSAQALGLITSRLLGDGLLQALDVVRGKIGQPSMPLALNAKGAYAIGVKIGRRNTDCLLVDFTGQVIERKSIEYAFPDASVLFETIAQHIAALTRALGSQSELLSGVGVAAPYLLGGWHKILSVSDEQALRWNTLNIAAEIGKITQLPVSFARDTAAACVAELHLGKGRELRQYLYFFVDTFIGGGVVLNSQLLQGLNGNAGAVASLPLAVASANEKSRPEQLVSRASLWDLEQSLKQAGLDASAAYDFRALNPPYRELSACWIQAAAPCIAQAVVSGNAFLDMQDVVIDGAMHPDLLDELIEAVKTSVQDYSLEGTWTPSIVRGAAGSDARALGGALLPLQEYFAGSTMPLLSPKPMRA